MLIDFVAATLAETSLKGSRGGNSLLCSPKSLQLKPLNAFA
jgi:hypothetical protein